jgi:hypothetical protein
MITLVFYLQQRHDLGKVQTEAMSGAESFLVYSSQDIFHRILCFKAFFIGGFPIMKRTSYPTLVI